MEWQAMMRFAAYALFVLACVLPGVYLRDIAAAEAQCRVDRYSFRRRGWPEQRCRRLGISGVEHLGTIFLHGYTSKRRDNAFLLLGGYHTPYTTRVFMESIASHDEYLAESASCWFALTSRESDLRSYLDGLGGEQLLQLLLAVPKSGTPGSILWVLWKAEPDRAENAAIQWIQATESVEAVQWFLHDPARMPATKPGFFGGSGHVSFVGPRS